MDKWLTYSPVSGHGNTQITLSATTLTELEDRIATLIATGTQGGQTLSASTVVTQKYLTLTEIYFKNLTWVTDVAWSGGTADKNNCTYAIFAKYSDGSEEDITNKATISGSLVVSATTATARQSVGTLTLTATYEGKTCTGNVTAYQEAPLLSEIFFNNLEWATDVAWSGGTADKNNCTYTIFAKYSNNIQVDVTSEAEVTGSLVIPATTNTTRQSVGNLELTATFGGKTCTGNVTAYQEAPSLSEIFFNNLEWAIDIPSSGGTATKDNCTYTIFAKYSNNIQVDITSKAEVSGSLQVSPNYVIGRHSAGTLTLTATYEDKTCTGSIEVYQELQQQEISAITFNSLTWATNVAASGGTATKDNCAYQIDLILNNGIVISDITSLCTVSGSIVVEPHYELQSNQDGLLTLQGEYNGFTCYGSVNVYRDALTINDIVNIDLSGLTWNGSDIDCTGGTVDYTNCDYDVNLNIVDGSVINITDIANVSGSTWIPFSNIMSRHTGGTLTVVAEYSGFTDSDGVAIWQEAYDYYKDWLTIENTGNTISYGNTQGHVSPTNRIIFQYSTDLGRTWSNFPHNSRLKINSGTCVKVRGPEDDTHFFRMSGLENCIVYGNVMSLVNPFDYRDAKDLYGSNSLTSLFTYSKITRAENLILQATGLTSSCYSMMFRGCQSLTTVPKLPATTLAHMCYDAMFNGCTSLTTAPALPATTLARECYSGMFAGCTSLSSAPVLPATTLARECYRNMFDGCTSLTTPPELPSENLADFCYWGMFSACTSLKTAPALPATTLASSCYYSMFNGCTKLTTAPELPATTLASYCYRDMFNGCTSLTTAPALPANTLAEGCYYNMFADCANLTTAPELPAITLVDSCYKQMFYRCTKLNYIKMLATDISASNCLSGWVIGVASTGTFVKNASITSLPRGDSGIPYGWTVENNS